MIGYYAHHVGEGHVTRAMAIARHLRAPVTILSSREPPEGYEGAWVTLPRDDADPPFEDPTADGLLHFAPLHAPGLRDRMAALAHWVTMASPRLLVADVSVEVAVFARLLGVPVVAMAMPGDRGDAAHALGYRAASAVLAPWPAWAAPLTPAPARLRAVGPISRFDGRAPAGVAEPRRVCVLLGSGGADIAPVDLDAARAATPGWTWEAVGPPLGDWTADPWPALCRACVVVCHAGQNAIADVAAARRPAIVIPQPRPHDEQLATAAVLHAAGLATVRRRWPAPGDWPGLLAVAARARGERWSAWSDGDGARRAAAQLDALLPVGAPVA